MRPGQLSKTPRSHPWGVEVRTNLTGSSFKVTTSASAVWSLTSNRPSLW